MRQFLTNTHRRLQTLLGPSTADTLARVPDRFLQAFHDHGVETAQIPRLLPELALADLRTPDTLLAALTPALLDKTAALFGIRREWLEGVDDRIYEYLATYKEPALLLGHLGRLHRQHGSDAPYLLRILTTTPRLDNESSSPQLLAPVLVEPIASLGEERIDRFHIYQDGFTWDHPPARLELKAIARVAYDMLHKPIPLVVIHDDVMDELLEGRLIPRRLLSGSVITNPSLEDYVTDSHDSHVAKETDELPIVLDFIEAYRLQQAFTHPSLPEPGTEKSPPAHSPAAPASSGKRVISQQDWQELLAVAAALWAQDPTITYTEMIRRLKKLPQLRAASNGESAIQKHLREIAPPGVRGKSGRKPKQSA